MFFQFYNDLTSTDAPDSCHYPILLSCISMSLYVALIIAHISIQYVHVYYVFLLNRTVRLYDSSLCT